MSKKKRSRSFILTLSLIAIMSYFVITLVQLQLEIRDKKEISAQVNQQYQSQQLENDELQQILDNGDASKYIERVARDVLGYVLPGERVYYDTSSGN
ncbi:MAG: septum formation initiator family protein [Oscillospiraceae bacterium]